jgi:hypothetical protein
LPYVFSSLSMVSCNALSFSALIVLMLSLGIG